MPIEEIQHARLGRVAINTRQNTHRVSARWKKGLLSLNVPQGIGLPTLQRILDDMAPKLLASRPNLLYTINQELHLPLLNIVIRQQNFAPDRIIGCVKPNMAAIEVGSNFAFNDESTSVFISNALCRVAKSMAADLLIPHARKLAQRINRFPVGWTISTGHRILGQCSSNGIIALSYILLFLPEHLCNYVIYHELTHLSEMNHSPRFHQLLNSYLNGRERQLKSELNRYEWPVLRH